MEELTDKIDRYLSGKMSSEEKGVFELEIENDNNLKNEVKLQQRTVNLLEQAAYISTKEKVKNLNNKNKRTIQLRPLLKVASILIVVLGSSYFFISQQYSNQALYKVYASDYPDYITVMGDGSQDVQLHNAMQFYNGKEYVQANKLFKELVLNQKYKSDVLVYHIACLVEIGKANEAIELGDSLDAEYLNSPVQWQLILAHLASGTTDGLIERVVTFRKNNSGYQETKSKELLEDLSSFWR